MRNARRLPTFYWLLALLLFADVACMPKVEEDEVVPTVTLSSHAISGSRSNAKITLTGTCPISTYLFRVMVDAREFTVGEAAGTALSAYAASSGTPVGVCQNGVLTIQYPVPNPTLNRRITFKVKARLSDGRSSLEWALRAVSYSPPTESVPGFAIGSVGAASGTLTPGGIMSAAGVSMMAIGGEFPGVPAGSPSPPNILTSTQVQLRSGLHGILLE